MLTYFAKTPKKSKKRKQLNDDDNKCCDNCTECNLNADHDTDHSAIYLELLRHNNL